MMDLLPIWNSLRHASPRRRSGAAGLRRANKRNFPQGPVELLEDRTLLAQVVVLNQAANFPGDFNFWASSTDSAVTTGSVMYEDISFAVDTEFNNVAWQGLYEDADVGQNPAAPNTGTWRINIWNDNGFGTGPGVNLLSTQDVSAASVNSEFVANADIGGGVQAPVFNFGTNLSSTFEATANAVFWVSVISISTGINDPAWGWMSGVGPGNGSVQQTLGVSVNIPRAGDRALRLINNTGPAAPTLVAPIGTTDELQPEFSWTAVAEADHYDLWVNVFGSNELVFRNQNVIGTAFTAPSPLEIEETYIWTVRGVAADGTGGEWATHATFTVEVDAALAAPTNLQPTGTSELTPTFQWSAVAGADRYDIWVNVRGSNELVFRNTNVTGTSITSPSTLQAEQEYIWTVRALDSIGAPGPWATHVTFVAVPQGVPPAAAPNLIAPTGTITDTTPDFQWTSVAGADHYDFWLNIRGSNELVIRDENVSGTTFTPATPLEAEQQYIWTVRAISADGTFGEWATHATFDIATEAAPPGSVPNILGPIGTIPTPTPRFEWTAVAGATRYDLWVNVFGSNELVFRNQNVTTTEFDSQVSLTDGQTYIWTVRAFVGTAAGDWAPHATFTVDVQIVADELRLEAAEEIDDAMSEWEATEWWAEEETQTA